MRSLIIWLLLPWHLFANHLPKVVTAPAKQSTTGASASYSVGHSFNDFTTYFLSSSENFVGHSNSSGSLNLYGSYFLGQVWEIARGAEGADIIFDQVLSEGILLSTASRLVPQDIDSFSDVYTIKGTNFTRVSVSLNPIEEGGDSRNACASTDGASIVFESCASLTEVSASGFLQIYFWTNGGLEMISQIEGIPGENHSRNATISGNGQVIAFESRARNLGVQTDKTDILIHRAGQLQNVSSSIPGEVGRVIHSRSPCLNYDGTILVFVSVVKNEDMREHEILIAYKPESAQYNILATNVVLPDNLFAGNTVIYSVTNAVMAWDGFNNHSRHLFSAEGIIEFSAYRDLEHVVFTSLSTNLVSNGPSEGIHVYYWRQADNTVRWIDYPRNSLRPGNAFNPQVLLRGTYIRFDSDSGNLSANDLNNQRDVFVLNPSQLFVASKRNENLPSSTSLGAHYLTNRTLSSSGRHVLINSSSGDMAENKNGLHSLFLKDLSTGSNLNLLAELNLPIPPPVAAMARMSADTRFLFFEDRKNALSYAVDRQNSYFHNLPIYSFSTNGEFQISIGNTFPRFSNLLHIRPENILHTFFHGNISVADAGFLSMISPDGRYLAGWSEHHMLQGGFGTHIALIDLIDPSTNVITLAPNPSFRAFPIEFSHNSRSFGFIWGGISEQRFGTGGVVRLPDLEVIPVGTNIMRLRLDSIGERVVFQTFEAGSHQLWWKDLDSRMLKRVTLRNGISGPANGNSSDASISADGNYVVFSSQAPDLISGDTNGYSDVFLWDARSERTILLSSRADGSGSGNGPSFNPILGYDGQTILFESFASDLVPNDFNQQKDIFIAHLPTLDDDQDGLYDDWEIAHFGNLLKDGSEDTDSDGALDRAEFRAGTNPTDHQSVFMVTRLFNISANTLALTWVATPGKRYVVEAKNSLDEPWQVVSGEIIALTSTGRFSEPSSTQPHRFYRVRLLD